MTPEQSQFVGACAVVLGATGFFLSVPDVSPVCAAVTEVVQYYPAPEVKPLMLFNSWSWPIEERLETPIPVHAMDAREPEPAVEIAQEDSAPVARHHYRYHYRHWRHWRRR